MKKKLIIIISAIISLIIALFVAFNIWYLINLKSIGQDELVTFTIKEGTGVKTIIDNLYSANLIRNKDATYIYVRLNNKIKMQAGTYELNRNMSTKAIIMNIVNGNVKNNDLTITFIEGKRFTTYINQIATAYNLDSKSIIKTLSSQDYLKELINKYWFLTDDILNTKIYYPLEGYLFPDTYIFPKDASIEDIITKMLDNTASKLEPYHDEITNGSSSIHAIMTLASIVELEGASDADRSGVAGVFYNRIKAGWTLGSDVTTYYSVQKDFSTDLTIVEINACNAYNTRSTCFTGLPVGPICSPGLVAIKAAIEPDVSDYYYFVADKNKKTYFSKTESEHIAIVNRLKNEGLWYTYE